MNWQEVCADPVLQDLPYKVELNEYGQVVMSPASNQHGRFQTRIAILLAGRLPLGEVITECSIETEKGIKVADVAWVSNGFLATHGYATPYPRAPEICVEVTSPSNSRRELQEKMALYFERGALEVWACDSMGKLTFETPGGTIGASLLAPGVPSQV